MAQFQAETSINDAQSDQGAAQSNMRQGPERGFCRALVDGMMNLAKDGLDEKKNDDKDTNYRVAVVYLLIGVSSKGL